jgi:hypothetical protein
MRRTIDLFLLLVLLLPIAHAQDISDDWQRKLEEGSQPHRILLHILKGSGNGWTGTFSSIDRDPVPLTITTVSLQNGTLIFTIKGMRLSYTGQVDPNGAIITGTLTQGQSMALQFERATKETAWPTV